MTAKPKNSRPNRKICMASLRPPALATAAKAKSPPEVPNTRPNMPISMINEATWV